VIEFEKKLRSNQWSTSSQTIEFETHSDQIGGSATFLFAFNKDYYTSVAEWDLNIRNSPPTQNGFQTSIYEPFNNPFYSIPIDDANCHLKTHHERNQRQPSVSSTIEICEDITPHLGYQIFDQDYPAPLPSTNQEGFFGPLFGITFYDPKSEKQLIRAISIAEYVTTFGYDLSFNTAICKTLQNPCLLCQIIPARTMTAIATKLQELMTKPLNSLLTNQAERYDLLRRPVSASTL
jgi:hypothetical protein